MTPDTPTPALPDTTVIGRVVHLRRDKMYGFVQLPDGREPFFHRSHCEPPGAYDDLVQDESIVAGELLPGREGRPRIQHVRWATAEEIDLYADQIGQRGNR